MASSEKIISYTDGGSRGNPGPSATGYVLYDEHGEELESGGEYLGITTNNQAEYQAVKLALEKAKQQGAQRVEMYMDSMLVVNQVAGRWKVKNRDLWPIYQSILELVKEFESVTMQHVRREKNKAADQMVNDVLDAQART